MRLNLNPKAERYQLIDPVGDGEGVAIVARPALSEVIEQAKGDDAFLAFAEEIRASVEATEGEEVAEMSPALLRSKGKVGVLFSKAVARLVIEAWEGVEDPDGSPAPVTPDRVDAFIDVPAIYDAFSERFLGRWLVVDQEKNGFAPSPSGTSAGAPTTARPARHSAKTARGGKQGR
jgi:hypothetical protein